MEVELVQRHARLALLFAGAQFKIEHADVGRGFY